MDGPRFRVLGYGYVLMTMFGHCKECCTGGCQEYFRCHECCKCVPKSACVTVEGDCSCESATELFSLSSSGGNPTFSGTVTCGDLSVDLTFSFESVGSPTECFLFLESSCLGLTGGSRMSQSIRIGQCLKSADSFVFNVTGADGCGYDATCNALTITFEAGDVFGDPPCFPCECFPRCIFITYETDDCFGAAFVCFNEGTNNWTATINTHGKVLTADPNGFDPCAPIQCPIVDVELFFEEDLYGNCTLVLAIDGVEYSEIPTCVEGGGFTTSFTHESALIEVASLFCDSGFDVCCSDSPDTLTASVEFPCCSATVTLDRVFPGMDYWTGVGYSECTGHAGGPFPDEPLQIALYCHFDSEDNKNTSLFQLAYNCGSFCSISPLRANPDVATCEPFFLEYDEISDGDCCDDPYVGNGSIIITE